MPTPPLSSYPPPVMLWDRTSTGSRSAVGARHRSETVIEAGALVLLLPPLAPRLCYFCRFYHLLLFMESAVIFGQHCSETVKSRCGSVHTSTSHAPFAVTASSMSSQSVSTVGAAQPATTTTAGKGAPLPAASWPAFVEATAIDAALSSSSSARSATAVRVAEHGCREPESSQNKAGSAAPRLRVASASALVRAPR